MRVSYYKFEQIKTENVILNLLLFIRCVSSVQQLNNVKKRKRKERMSNKFDGFVFVLNFLENKAAVTVF